MNSENAQTKEEQKSSFPSIKVWTRSVGIPKTFSTENHAFEVRGSWVIILKLHTLYDPGNPQDRHTSEIPVAAFFQPEEVRIE